MKKMLSMDTVSFKFGDTDTDIKIRPTLNGVSLPGEGLTIFIKVKNLDGLFLVSKEAKWDSPYAIINSSDFSTIPVGIYEIELWVESENGVDIFPNYGFINLKINKNATSISGNLVSSMTLQDFQNQFQSLASELKEKGVQGEQGIQGPPGIQGVPGKDFVIAKTFPNVASMSGDGLQDGDFVIISSTVEEPDNADLYVWNGTAFTFITDMSGATGIKGDDGKQGPPGIQGVPGQDGANGTNGINAYEYAVSGGYTGSQIDFQNKLAFQLKMPTSYYLDRTTTPWSLVFDNGSILQLPDYDKGATIYGYGFVGNMNSSALDNYPLVGNVIKTARGTVTLDTWKTTKDSETYWSDKTTVINPINDTSLFDFTNASFGRTGTYQSRQKNVIRVMYALGIWSESEILSLGAISVK